jgi:CRP/FNR family transcriptional regulator
MPSTTRDAAAADTAQATADMLASLAVPDSTLASLPQDLLQQLAQLPVIELPAGTPVFDRNGRCAGFPLLLAGCVRVFRPFANGRSIELYRVTRSEICILSLSCLLGSDAYPACGVTAEPTRMVMMPPAMFDAWMASDASFRNAMFRKLGERLVNVMTLLEEVVTMRLDARLAAALLAHSEAACSDTIRLTHQQLADELGTVREMVSRVLDDFARQGLVSLGRGRIEVADAARLGKLARALM